MFGFVKCDIMKNIIINLIKYNMQKRTVTKTQIKKERNSKKVSKVIKQKGYPSGKLPENKELHHVKPVSVNGKTTKKNTRVVTKAKHKQIHKNRNQKGKI